MLAGMAPRILLVEDDDGIAVPLRRTLEREGYAVERVATGQAGLDRVAAGDVDLVVLDLGLPDMDGLDVCRDLRAAGYACGVMILTARGGELDRVVGLDVGADDYLAKPFGLGEFLARTRALLRRTARSEAASAVPAGSAGAPAAAAVTRADGIGSGARGGEASRRTGLRIEEQARRVWVEERELALTTKEFDLLAVLAAERGAVVTRERLMDEVWDENWYGSTKTLDVTMGRLRSKLEAASAPATIVTVRGIGFRLEAGPDDA
jgi:DNA-binding response OmpR family regulator